MLGPILALALAPAASTAMTVAATATAPAPSVIGLIQTPELSDPAISPDGRFVAYRRTQAVVGTNSYEVSWWIAPLTVAGPARRLADGGAPIWTTGGTPSLEPPQWSPDSRRLYFRALVGQEVQVWRADLDGGAPIAVTADAANVEDFAVLDPDHLVYRTGATRAAVTQAEADEANHGVRVDKTIDTIQDFTRAGFIDGRLAAERLNGHWFNHFGLLGDAPPRFTVIGVDGAGSRPATPAETAALSRPNAYVARLAPTTSAQGRVATLDGRSRLVVTGAPGSSSAQAFADRVVGFRWRPGHDQLVVTTRDAAEAEALWRWDLATGHVVRLLATDGVLADSSDVSHTHCPLNGAAAVCVAASPLTPPHLVRVDLDTGQVQELDRPAIPPNTGPSIEARTLTWADSEGRRFGGVLMLPAARTPGVPLPLFIAYYECPGFQRGGMGDEWPLAPLAAHGVATLCIDQTHEVRAFDTVGEYQAALSGITAIVDRLAGDGLIDRRRVGMGGLSFGSEVTMWAVTHSDLVAAASIASPQLEPGYYWFNGVAGRDNHAMLMKAWGLGDPDQTRPAWEKVSPALQTDRIHTPVLMQFAEQEFRYEMELYAKLSNSPIPVDMYVFPDEGHIKVEPLHRLAIYQRNLDWFRFWLKDETDPDPAKAEQYRLWTAQKAAWRASLQPPDQDRSHTSTSARSNNR